MDGLCGAAQGEDSKKLSKYRYGYREHHCIAQAGSIPLDIPKLH